MFDEARFSSVLYHAQSIAERRGCDAVRSGDHDGARLAFAQAFWAGSLAWAYDPDNKSNNR